MHNRLFALIALVFVAIGCLSPDQFALLGDPADGRVAAESSVTADVAADAGPDVTDDAPEVDTAVADARGDASIAPDVAADTGPDVTDDAPEVDAAVADARGDAVSSDMVAEAEVIRDTGPDVDDAGLRDATPEAAPPTAEELCAPAASCGTCVGRVTALGRCGWCDEPRGCVPATTSGLIRGTCFEGFIPAGGMCRP